MHLFEKLRSLRAFEKQHLDFCTTVEDLHLIGEIGYHQSKGKPVTLKQLFLLDVGSLATVQRRLRRFKGRGLVQHGRVASDGRAVELTLSPKCIRIFATYDRLISRKPPAQGAASHICGFCDGEAGSRRLLVSFLAQGLKRGDKCLLVAPASAQAAVLAELHPRVKSPGQLMVSEGHASADAQVGFLRRFSQEARQAGQAICLAADMAWTLPKKLRVEAVLDIETRFDSLARRLPLIALCVYDARHFSSGEFLQVVRCHRDHSHRPIVIG